ncbi:MAG: FAD-dependent oxidoreductase [Candidatus Xenobia bacterium]
MKRRDFLLGVLRGAALAVGWSLLPPGVAVAQTVQPWEGPHFIGDQYEPCHALRDGKLKPALVVPEADAYDCVVVGGGMAGLLTGFLLRHRNLLVLEKDERTGGNAKCGHWEGVTYPMGALYMGQPDAMVSKVLKAIGIDPVPVPRPVDAWVSKGSVVPDILHHAMDMPYSRDVRRSFKDAWEYFAALNDSDECPPNAVAESTPRQLALDNVSFASHYKGRWAAPVMQLLDQYSRSVFGVSSEEVSAFGMINQFCGEFPPIHSLPGGNAAVAEKVAAELGDRVLTGCFTWRIERDGSTYRVEYLRDGKPHAVRARTVVVSAPQHIAARMIAGLPNDRVALMQKVRHGAYLVGLLFAREPICDASFDIWSAGRWFTDIVVADWVASGGKPSPHRKAVYVAYIPMGEDYGRAELLKPDYDKFRRRLLADLDAQFPGASKKVAGVQFVRYGHPMIVPYPGYVRHVALKLQQPLGQIYFAHTDTGSLPCIEACIAEATRTAGQVDTVLG